MRTVLDIIDNKDPLADAWLEPFKQYASVSDDGRDALLLTLLRSAILRVQEYADRALFRCRVRQTCRPDAETGQIRLYLGGGEDLSVTYDYDGSEVPYVRNTANLITVQARGSVISVEYTTRTSDSWRDQARPTVFRYATALYDGEPLETLNSILNEVL